MPKKIPKKQKVTYFKRKRGLIKKCIEISNLCSRKVYLYMADEHNEQLVEYCSTPQFNISEVIRTKLEEKDQNNFTKYENVDLNMLVGGMTPHQF